MESISNATSSTLEYGSWTDHGSTGISSCSSKVYNVTSPSVIQTAEGGYCMNFGSFLWGRGPMLWDIIAQFGSS